jgi:hypothetical protein
LLALLYGRGKHQLATRFLQTNIFEGTRSESLGLWSKFTQWRFVSTDRQGGLYLFKPLEEPVRLFTIDDVQDYRPFITKNNWNLERIFCRPKNSRYIAIVKGPGALTRSQIKSNLACSIVGTTLIVLVPISFLVWLEIGGWLVALVFFVALILAWNSLQGSRRLVKVAKDFIAVSTEGKIEDRKGDPKEDIELILEEQGDAPQDPPFFRSSAGLLSLDSQQDD